MELNDPRLISECQKIAEQRFWDVPNFADLVLQTYGSNVKFIQVYDSAEKNAITRLYNLDDVVDAEEKGEIEFLNNNEHTGHANGEDWCLQFTNGITLQPIKYSDVLELIEPGEDPENLICEVNSKFRNAALALAALAGIGQSYDIYNHHKRFAEPSTMDVITTNDTCVAPKYKDEPIANVKYNNMSGITGAKTDWRKHRIDYTDKNGDIRYSLGKGHLSSRAHNPGNLVVNNLDSAKKIGAIGFYQNGKGNKYAVFANDKDGQKALENWWFSGNNSNQTVKQLLPKFAPSHENNLNNYFNTMKRFCIPLDKTLKQFTPLEKQNLINAIKTQEGFNINKASEYHNRNTKQ